MREFDDENGHAWIAAAAETEGVDYKGRYHLVLRPANGGDPVALTDVQWNTERTAARTLSTMSVVELRRRLRSARGRSAEGDAAGAA